MQDEFISFFIEKVNSNKFAVIDFESCLLEWKASFMETLNEDPVKLKSALKEVLERISVKYDLDLIVGLEYSLNSYFTSDCPWFIFQEVKADDGIKIILLSTERDAAQVETVYKYLLNRKDGWDNYSDFFSIFNEVKNSLE